DRAIEFGGRQAVCVERVDDQILQFKSLNLADWVLACAARRSRTDLAYATF
ncbi:unnamed protein product, partial [Mycena citricolor]